ncbi:MAG: ArsR/SmtB family transcription factor [Erysipelotrichaceae bacterium]
MEHECHCNQDGSEQITAWKAVLKQQSYYQDLADFFKVLHDPTRLKIVTLLMEQPMCVCDIATTLDMSHSSISHQMKVLRAQRVVITTRLGKHIQYQLADEHVEKVLTLSMEHLEESR